MFIHQIDLRSLLDTNQGSVKYSPFNLGFRGQTDGKIINLDPFSRLIKEPDLNLLGIKENQTVCGFRAYLFDRNSGGLTFMFSVTDFINMKNLTQLKSEEEHFTCSPLPADPSHDPSHIKYLQINDITVVPFNWTNTLMYASDFNYGLLVWKLSCGKPKNISYICGADNLFNVYLP